MMSGGVDRNFVSHPRHGLYIESRLYIEKGPVITVQILIDSGASVSLLRESVYLTP